MFLPEMLGPKPYQNTAAFHYRAEAELLEKLPPLLAAKNIKLIRIATVPGRHHWHLQKGWGAVLFRTRTAADLSGLELELTPTPGILRRGSSCRLQKSLHELLLQSGARVAEPTSGPSS